MADIALATADKISAGTLTVLQHTFVAASAITAGAPVYLAAATGKVAHADGNGAGEIATVWGVALKTVAAGEAVTVVRTGLLTGYVLDGMDYGETAFLSDTVGRIADAAGTAVIKVGTVVPIYGTLLGVAPDKGLLVEIVTNYVDTTS